MSGLQVSKDSIHRRIRKYLILKKDGQNQSLTACHKIKRLEWAKKHMSFRGRWLSITFFDEKKWNLDKPNGWIYCWYDLLKEPKTFFSRQLGEKSVMVCVCGGCIWFNSHTTLAILSRKQKTRNYQEALKKFIVILWHYKRIRLHI